MSQDLHDSGVSRRAFLQTGAVASGALASGGLLVGVSLGAVPALAAGTLHTPMPGCTSAMTTASPCSAPGRKWARA